MFGDHSFSPPPTTKPLPFLLLVTCFSHFLTVSVFFRQPSVWSKMCWVCFSYSYTLNLIYWPKLTMMIWSDCCSYQCLFVNGCNHMSPPDDMLRQFLRCNSITQRNAAALPREIKGVTLCIFVADISEDPTQPSEPNSGQVVQACWKTAGRSLGRRKWPFLRLPQPPSHTLWKPATPSVYVNPR